MAEVKKARLFLRRGTDTDRIATILCEGELGYSTDAFRVVVGDGLIFRRSVIRCYCIC